jgi:hypothetical protein
VNVMTISTARLALLLRAAFVNGYTETVRSTTQASVRLGEAITRNDIDEWTESILTVDERQQVGQFAAALLVARFDNELRDAGLSTT